MRAPIHASRGFTLLELMIAVVIGLIILAALTSFFVQTSQNRREMERNARQIENGRYAVNALRDDLALAGFYADVSQPSSTVWETPAGCETDPTKMGLVPAQLAPHLPVPVFVYPKGVGKPDGCTPDYLADTDVIVIRRMHTEPTSTPAVGATAADKGRLFVQVSECSKDNKDTPFLFDTGANVSNFKLKKIDCVTGAPLRRYREQLYYVRDYSVTAGDGIPTLVRVELDGSGTTVVSNAMPIVDGIDNLRVDWGVDTDGDGLPDVWTRCDGATAADVCDAGAWSNVTAAKIYVLSRNIEPSTGYVDDKTYSMGLSGATTATNDAFKRHVYSAQVAMPNRSGPREPALAS